MPQQYIYYSISSGYILIHQLISSIFGQFPLHPPECKGSKERQKQGLLKVSLHHPSMPMSKKLRLLRPSPDMVTMSHIWLQFSFRDPKISYQKRLIIPKDVQLSSELVPSPIKKQQAITQGSVLVQLLHGSCFNSMQAKQHGHWKPIPRPWFQIWWSSRRLETVSNGWISCDRPVSGKCLFEHYICFFLGGVEM